MDIPENPAVIAEHPLLNSLIVDKIFSYIKPSLTDLKNIRQVCKFWHEHTLPKWRKTAVINITPDTPLFSVKPVSSIGAYKFLQEFENPQSFYQFSKRPFYNYKISDFTIDINACNNEPESKQFWDKIGPHMEYVQFKRCEFLDDDGSSFVELLVRKMPNIKELVLTFISSKAPTVKVNNNSVINLDTQSLPHLKTLSFQGRVYFRKGLNHLLKCTPELVTIKSTDRIGYESEFDDPIRAISSAKQNAPECLANLKHLDFINSTALHRNSVWSYLSNSNIRLESLTARLSPDTYNFHEILSRGIEDFLISQRKCLKRLEVFRNQFYEPFDQFLERFQMGGLTQLKLWGNVAKNFHFLKSAPNLQVLHVNTDCFEKWTELKQFTEISRNSVFKGYEKDMVQISNENLMQGVMLAGLKVLHITFDFSVQSWTQLGQWIPNLEELRAIINHSSVSVICRQWPNLAELGCLFGSNIDNASITGSGLDKDKEIAIVNLDKLDIFQFDALCNTATLSDDAAVNGFLKMSALKSLQICVSNQMSVDIEEKLMKNIPKCRIIRNYGSGEHSNYECCQRRQFLDEVASGFKKQKTV